MISILVAFFAKLIFGTMEYEAWVQVHINLHHSTIKHTIMFKSVQCISIVANCLHVQDHGPDQFVSIYSQETASTEKLEWPSWTLIVIFVLITMSIGWIPFIALTVVSIYELYGIRLECIG